MRGTITAATAVLLALALALAPTHAFAAPTWRERDKLTAGDPQRAAQFGHAIAIDGDTLVVGAPTRIEEQVPPGSGAVYVFDRASDGRWKQSQKLTNEASLGNGFGSSVAIKNDVLVVGAPRRVDLSLKSVVGGQVDVFQRGGGVWSKVASFGPLDVRAALSAFDSVSIGASVGVTEHLIVVGAPEGATSSVIVLEDRNGSWSPTRLLTNTEIPLSFGQAVALTADRLIAAAPVNQGFAAYSLLSFDATTLLGRSSTPGCKLGAFGAAVAIDGLTAIFGSGELRPTSTLGVARSGFAAVYALPIDATSEPTAVFTPVDTACGGGANGVVGSGFGAAVHVQGDRAIVGAPGDVAAPGGSAFVYERAPGSLRWSAPARVRAANLVSGDAFASSVVLGRESALIGAPSKSTVTAEDGAVFVFRRALPEGDACIGDGECHSGACVDSVCCNETCGGGRTDDCVACSLARGAAKDGECGPASPIVVCRAASNECDVEDHCNGTIRECPADLTRPNGITCASGTCTAGACVPSNASAPVGAAAAVPTTAGCGCHSSARGDSACFSLIAIAAIGAFARRSRSRS